MNDTLNYSSFTKNIPEFWPLVPVRGKVPYFKDWVNRVFTTENINSELDSGNCSGLGLRLGFGFLAVDFDGSSAWPFFHRLAGLQDFTAFSFTTSWTSDRPGRKQLLFTVDEKDWARVRGRKIPTGAIGDDGKPEFLEFHWLGRQSVLPPSIHPDTGKPYRWIRNPVDFPPLLAPDWLLEIIENYHTEYAGVEALDNVRVPARLYKVFKNQMMVWLLARRFDVSRWVNSGYSKGSGIGKFTLQAASLILKRSPGHIRKLLCAAKNSGLIRNYTQRGDWITVFYSSLQKAIALSGIDALGPIASVSVDLLSNLSILSTEIEAQSLQRSSFYRQSREENAQNRPLNEALSLLSPSEKLAGVLGRSARFIFCDRNFRFYGGSQMLVSQFRGCNPVTVSRHLSNSYRLAASLQRNYREDLVPVIKKQLLEALPLLHNLPSGICLDDGLINIGGDWFKPRCNIYGLNHRLVSARWRRFSISQNCTGGAVGHKTNLLIQTDLPGDLENKAFLYELEREILLKAELVFFNNQDKE